MCREQRTRKHDLACKGGYFIKPRNRTCQKDSHAVDEKTEYRTQLGYTLGKRQDELAVPEQSSLCTSFRDAARRVDSCLLHPFKTINLKERCYVNRYTRQAAGVINTDQVAHYSIERIELQGDEARYQLEATFPFVVHYPLDREGVLLPYRRAIYTSEEIADVESMRDHLVARIACDFNVEKDDREYYNKVFDVDRELAYLPNKENDE